MAVSYPSIADLIPTADEMDQVRRLVGFLYVFKKLSVKMEAEKKVTASALIPDYNAAIDHCDACVDSDEFKFMHRAIIDCRGKLIDYYTKTNVVAMTAAYFDPRCRRNYYVMEEFPQHEIEELDKFVVSEFEAKNGGASNAGANTRAETAQKMVDVEDFESKFLY